MTVRLILAVMIILSMEPNKAMDKLGLLWKRQSHSLYIEVEDGIRLMHLQRIKQAEPNMPSYVEGILRMMRISPKKI